MRKLWLALAALLGLMSPAMATSLSITASQVLYVSGDLYTDQVCATTITAGAALYKTSTGTWGLLQGDGTAEEAGSLGYGIALGGCSAGQRITIAAPGASVTLGAGAAPAAGTVYTSDDTAGSIRPNADNGTTDKVTVLGVGTGSNAIKLFGGTYNAGAVIP